MVKVIDQSSRSHGMIEFTGGKKHFRRCMHVTNLGKDDIDWKADLTWKVCVSNKMVGVTSIGGFWVDCFVCSAICVSIQLRYICYLKIRLGSFWDAPYIPRAKTASKRLQSVSNCFTAAIDDPGCFPMSLGAVWLWLLGFPPFFFISATRRSKEATSLWSNCDVMLSISVSRTVAKTIHRVKWRHISVVAMRSPFCV